MQARAKEREIGEAVAHDADDFVEGSGVLSRLYSGC